jgi:hypothetical protein
MTTAKVVNAGQRVKAQGAPTEITWDLAKTRVAAAVGAEGVAHNKWVSASDTLWILGVRADMLEKVPGPKGTMVPSDTYKKVMPMVHAGFTARVQKLLAVTGHAKSGLTEEERDARNTWAGRADMMMSRIRSYLKKHEQEEGRGTKPPTTLAESIVKVLKAQRLRVKDAKDTKIDFDRDTVLEAFDVLIAELT